MHDPGSCSLIITTYNWPQALHKCLQTVAWQTSMPAEVIVADDGSGPATAEVVESAKRDFPTPLIFLTQEKIGRRKTRIDNIAIANAQKPYLIFIDHDMLLHPSFVSDHLSNAQSGYFLNGSRFLVDETETQSLLGKQTLSSIDLRGSTGKNSLNKLRVPLLMKFMAHRYRTAEKDIVEVRGCNMSFWKKDLIAVNGYDEAYGEWGREDSNIAVRLFNNGIRKKSLKFGAIAYHLHHAPGDKSRDAENIRMLQQAIDNKEKWAVKGLDQYLR
jgi:glycosyltransferase involved in cell wall biosynthesis